MAPPSPPPPPPPPPPYQQQAPWAAFLPRMGGAVAGGPQWGFAPRPRSFPHQISPGVRGWGKWGAPTGAWEGGGGQGLRGCKGCSPWQRPGTLWRPPLAWAVPPQTALEQLYMAAEGDKGFFFGGGGEDRVTERASLPVFYII